MKADDLGEPALTVAGFQLWIHGRQFPDSCHPYDGNWLRVTTHCGGGGASVWASGSILMTTDIHRFATGCQQLLDGQVAAATLDPLEPELCVRIEASDAFGHLDAQVEITPDHLAQQHKMRFEIDQSYLPKIIAECTAILGKYPVR